VGIGEATFAVTGRPLSRGSVEVFDLTLQQRRKESIVVNGAITSPRRSFISTPESRLSLAGVLEAIPTEAHRVSRGFG
jgi:hypothetical protein